MKNKIISGIAALSLISIMGTTSAFAVHKDVEVFKDINAGTHYTGHGAHASEAFSGGIELTDSNKLQRVNTKKITVYVPIFGNYEGYVKTLSINGLTDSDSMGTEKKSIVSNPSSVEDYYFNFDSTLKPLTANDGSKYFPGDANIEVSFIHRTKHVDLKIK
ncbi:hypothetical protein [Peptostreptococcus stomatis]|uniref:hypothetical protein n=1 Tax=Peptostreptococcus stomatis TaxID=341694 RepID=UPI0028D2E1B7|nr:hypothetical protein [Peptostreptococcus stomatis]